VKEVGNFQMYVDRFQSLYHNPGDVPIIILVGETVLDRELAMTRVGGDAELLKEIATLFLDDYPSALSDLHQALDRGDARAVERTAHGLKGSVANFGASTAVEAARSIENLGRAQKLAEAAQVLNTLELALAALRPELESL
jgi:HPt (histidine-containing phosphotransfer) domain-containing protein